MAEVKWIKLYTDMVRNKKIKRIRSLPEGNNIVLIWCLLLLQAGESNKRGALFLTDSIPFSVEDLSVELEFGIDTIRLALAVLEKYQMIQIFEDVICVKNWEEYQSVDGMEKIREQNRERKRRQRLRQNEQKLLGEMSRDMSRNVTRNVTQCHAIEEEEELEIDKEIDKEEEEEEKEEEKKSSSASSIPVEKTYQDNIGMITPIVAQSIEHWLNDGIEEALISRYIEVAVKRNKRSWAYVEKMIAGNMKINVKTLAQYEAMLKEKKDDEQDYFQKVAKGLIQ